MRASGTLKKALRVLAEKLHEEGKLDLDEGSIGGNFAAAKKGASRWAKPSAARGPRSWPIAAGNSVPLAITIDSASPHESKLMDETLAGAFLNELCEKLIGDKAYDSDPLDRHLDEAYGMEMIAPQPRKSEPDSGRQAAAPL